jgi:lipopolysaccharide biosynthesis glycosyltransferase
MNDYIEIVIGPDENYAMPCGILIQSIVLTNPLERIRFHIISEDLTDKSKSRFKQILKNTKNTIDFYTINPVLLDGLPQLNGSSATYIILFLADILPCEIERVLYLDADMMVLNSLTELWAVDITDYPAAGARSIMNDDIRNYNRLDYAPSMGYYNIGTQLINLNYWRKNNISKESLSFIINNPDKLKYCEQDVLNTILMDKWKTISPRYNFFQNYYMPIEDLLIKKELHAEIENARINPVIIHFISNPKPWHKEYNIMPLTKIWIFFKNMTPWKPDKLKYYDHGIKLLIYKIKHLLEILHLRRPYLWKADPQIDMDVIVNKIYNQIAEKMSLRAASRAVS